VRSKEVDRFIRTRILPEYRPIARLLRKLVKECAPTIKEIIDRTPIFRGNREIAMMNPTKRGITFALARSAELDDKYGMLAGAMRMRKLADVNRHALRYYIKQAVALDSADITAPASRERSGRRHRA
jgi:hypothetical protein